MKNNGINCSDSVFVSERIEAFGESSRVLDLNLSTFAQSETGNGATSEVRF
jgi:hypothetical protein